MILFLLTYVWATFKINKVREFNKKCQEKEREIDPLFNSIPKYYINMDRDELRRKSMERQIVDLKIRNIRRIPGINGKLLEENKKFQEIDDIKISDFKISRGQSQTTMGCFLSHIKAIKTSYENNDEMCIIMEDDIFLHQAKMWKFKFKDIVRKFPKDLEILNLASSCENIDKKEISFFDSRKKRGASCMCYLIKRQGMKKILDIVFTDGYVKHGLYARYISDLTLYQELNSYFLIPKLFLLNSLKLDSSITESFDDFKNEIKYSLINNEIINKYYN